MTVTFIWTLRPSCPEKGGSRWRRSLISLVNRDLIKRRITRRLPINSPVCEFPMIVNSPFLSAWTSTKPAPAVCVSVCRNGASRKTQVPFENWDYSRRKFVTWKWTQNTKSDVLTGVTWRRNNGDNYSLRYRA